MIHATSAFDCVYSEYSSIAILQYCNTDFISIAVIILDQLQIVDCSLRETNGTDDAMLRRAAFGVLSVGATFAGAGVYIAVQSNAK
jgi:hypothetical protein